MFSHVLDVILVWHCIIEPHKTRIRLILLVFRPRNPFFLEQAHDSRNLWGNIVQSIIGNPKVISTYNRYVIGFGWMGKTVVTGQKDSLFGEICKIGIAKRLSIVLLIRGGPHSHGHRILKPDLIEIIEGSTLNVGSMAGSTGCRSSGRRADGCGRSAGGQYGGRGGGLSQSPANSQRK